MTKHNAIIIYSYREATTLNKYGELVYEDRKSEKEETTLDSPILKGGERIYISKYDKIGEVETVYRTDTDNTMMYIISGIKEDIISDSVLYRQKCMENKVKDFGISDISMTEKYMLKDFIDKFNSTEEREVHIHTNICSILRHRHKEVRAFLNCDYEIICVHHFPYTISIDKIRPEEE